MFGEKTPKYLLSSEILSTLCSVIQGVFMLLCLQNCRVNGRKFLSDKTQIYLDMKIDTSFTLVFASLMGLNRDYQIMHSKEGGVEACVGALIDIGYEL